MAVKRVEVSVEVKNNTKVGFDDVKDDIEGFQSRIKTETAINLSINLASLRKQLEDVKLQIKQAQASGDFEAEINLRANAERLKQEITQAGRELRNFTRTGEKDVSVLGKLFSQVNQEIVNTREELLKAGKSTKGLDKIAKSLKDGSISAEKARIEIQKLGNSATTGALTSLKNGLKTAFGAFAIIELVRGIGSFIKTLLSAGSDLEEFGAKFNTVFAGIETKASTSFETLANSIGRSVLEIKNYGASLADVLKPLGFTTDESLKLSKNIVQLGEDLASFNNVSSERAQGALLSALTGEREALKSLGIVINEADLKTEAYTNGIAKQGQELTKQQKALATYNLLLKNSADAQGDALRTSESFANQLKRLKGVIRDVLAESGADVASSTASTLQSITDLVTKYGKITLVSVIETVKSVLAILKGAGSGISSFFSALGAENSGFFDLILKSLNVFNNGLKSLLINIELLGNIIADTFLNTDNLLGKVANNIGVRFRQGANKAIDALNRLSEALSSISGVQFRTFEKFDEGKLQNVAKNYASSFDTARNKLLELGAETITFNKNLEKSAGKSASDFTGAFDNVDDLIDKYNTLLNSSGGTGSKTDNAKLKELESEKKALEELEKKEKDLAEKRDIFDKRRLESAKKKIDILEKEQETVGDVIDAEIEKSEKLIEQLDKEIETVRDTIADLNNDIANLDTELADINLESTESLANRFVDITDEIRKLKDELAIEEDVDTRTGLISNIDNLEKEQKLIEENTTLEQRREAERVAGLSQAETILEELKARKEAIELEKQALEERKLAQQQELEVLQQKKDDEQSILEAFTQDKLELDEYYKDRVAEIEEQITDKLTIEANKRIDKLEELRQKALAAAEAMREAGLSASESASSNQSTVNVGGIVVNGSGNPTAVADQVNKIILNSSKNARKGTY